MIKNIVFDMGQVLVSYVGNLVCQIYIEDEQERKDEMCIRDSMAGSGPRCCLSWWCRPGFGTKDWYSLSLCQ